MTLLATSDLDRDDAGELRIDAAERAFAAGEQHSLELVYNEFGALVYSVCLRSVDEATAADITQEVFLAAWRHHRRYDPDRGGLAPWLCGIARNKVIDHFRSNGREARRVERIKASRPPTSQELEDVSLRMLLVDALETLSPRARQIMSMAFFEQLTHVEIAARTGIPLGTVKSDIRRSLDRLRHGLGYNHV